MSLVHRQARVNGADPSKAGATPATDAQTILSGLLRLGDCLVVVIAAGVSYWLRSGQAELPGLYLSSATLGALLTANFMHLAGVYSMHNLQRPAVQLGKLAGGWFLVIASLIALSFFTQTSTLFSRGWLILWLILSFGGFVALRAVALVLILRWQASGTLQRRVAIVGVGDLGQQVARQLRAGGGRDFRIVGFYDDGAAGAKPEIEGAPVRGTVTTLLQDIRRSDIDEVLVAVPWGTGEIASRTLKRLSTVPINIRICPDAFMLNLPVRGFSNVGGIPLLNISERPLSGWTLVIKNLEDRILGGVLIALSAPLMLTIAILIRLDSRGPALFRQRRYGFNNNEFTVFKFRTMHLASEPDPLVTQARRDDARITRIGALLRRTSLDELPQLINVLRGEMSLVGPRPHAVAHNEKYSALIDEYLGRHRVKPGITGWAQIHGLRGETQTPEQMRLRVQYDLNYIDNWSLLLDLKILMITAFVGFIHENAY